MSTIGIVLYRPIIVDNNNNNNKLYIFPVIFNILGAYKTIKTVFLIIHNLLIHNNIEVSREDSVLRASTCYCFEGVRDVTAVRVIEAQMQSLFTSARKRHRYLRRCISS